MESIGCDFEGRALQFVDDPDFVVDGGRNLFTKWDGEDLADSIGLIEPDKISTSFLGDQCLGSNADDTKDHSPSPANGACAENCSIGNLFHAGNSVLSSPISGKRAKMGDSQSPVPTCQVYGCNKDLSSSKDYHKRHKVCDVHSKTAVVIVNGIKQRFCQQCSRFHILAKFDEGKRSCRRSLAGHNERRRKPQFQFNTCVDASRSLFFSSVLSGGFFDLQRDNHSRHPMLEDEPFAVDAKLSQSLPKSVLHFHGMGKQYPSKNCLNAPSSIYPSSDSSCVLSLLSTPKQNLSSNSMAQPIISAENHHASCNTAQHSGAALGETSAEKNKELHAGATTGSEIPGTAPAQGTNTVNLLELSLHLHRVEHQKYFGQIKMENDNIFDSTTAEVYCHF